MARASTERAPARRPRLGPPPAPVPRLREGEVQVWRVDLDAVEERLLEALSHEERVRAEQSLRPAAAAHRAAARAVLRALLSRHSGVDPGELRITEDPRGKPVLEGEIDFSVSHSGSVGLIALARGLAVGIDVELLRMRRAGGGVSVGLARRAFGAERAARLWSIEESVRAYELTRAWARREAAIKCAGTPAAHVAGIAPLLTDLRMGDERAAAALACERRPERMRVLAWR